MVRCSGRSVRLGVLALAGIGFIGQVWTPAALGQVRARQQVERQLGAGQPSRENPEGPGPVAAPPDQEVEGRPNPDDVRKINSAKSVEELIDLAKEFVISRKEATAGLCIDKIIARQPNLLEDAKKQSPRSWNEFWFMHRAQIRERKLGLKDAAGRVKLAVWLHDAGVTSAAHATLNRALTIDKNLPEAKALADKWSLSVGGPVRLDLTYGLKEPLILDTMQDESVAVPPRKDRAFLVLPIAYSVGGTRLMIGKGDVKVKSDDGKLCTVTGIVLLDATSTGGAPATNAPLAERGKVPELKMQAGGDPLWEQVIVEPAARNKPQELTVVNQVHPFIRPVPGQRRQPGEQPQPAAGGNAPLGKQQKPAGGYAAFIVDIPQTFQSLECSYKGDGPLVLTAEFLKELGTALEKASPADRDRLAKAMSAAATNKSAPVALAALRKLNTVRAGGTPTGFGGGATAPKSTKAVIDAEKAMVAALGHESGQVRREAFNLLTAGDTGVTHETMDLIAGTTDSRVLNNLLAEAATFFTDLREAVAAAAETAAENNPAGAAPAPPPPGAPVDSTGMPDPLPGSGGAFSLLKGCLRNKQASVREQALDIVLANPSRHTSDALGQASDEAVKQLLARVPKMDDAKLKGAMFRALMARPNKAQMADTLKAFGDLRVVITDDNDPLLAEALRQKGATLARLLEMLAKADMSNMTSSNKLNDLVRALSADDAKPDAAVQKAMLMLAKGQLKAVGYQAPVKRGDQQRGGPEMGQGASGFDGMLAALAAGVNTDAQVARDAATMLLSIGQARVLHEKLQRLQGEAKEKCVQNLIRSLAVDKNLWGREALPVFLALQLTSTDAQTLRLSLSALAQILRGTDPKQRWRMNLAIKQGVETKQLVTHTLNGDERVSRPALDLLRDLGMSAAERAELEGAADEAARQTQWQTQEQNRSGKPIGAFACMVYLDIRAAQGGGPERGQMVRELKSIPLASAGVQFQRASQGGPVRVVSESMQIGPPEAKQSGQPSTGGAISINASPLIRAALASPEGQKAGLAEKIDPSTLRAEQVCELKYEQLGQWSGEVMIQDFTGEVSAEFPVRVSGAKIVLEPVTQ